ncbi:MAG: hypothetical protein N2578_06050, partial [Bdellovibrionaceae bacterium]|nr:hypothetical protein [Pseudobdellovibrionaceae bacterium]
MFGCCVFKQNKLIFVLFVVVSLVSSVAQPQEKTKPQKGRVVVDEAMVYKEPNFDSEVIGSVSKGSVHSISRKKWGPFHRIRLPSKQLGYIADSEIRPIINKNEITEKMENSSGRERPESRGRSRPLARQRLAGGFFEMMSFTESTMEVRRSTSLPLLGWRWSGENTFVEGPIYTDASLAFHWDAPNYYDEATGNPASGFILKGDILATLVSPQNRDVFL